MIHGSFNGKERRRLNVDSKVGAIMTSKMLITEAQEYLLG